MDDRTGNSMKDLVSLSMHDNLEKEFERLSSFFKNIMTENYDCIVIISRRCYVVFLMFTILYDWNFDNIITDLGIYANRKKLETSNKIIVVDDIGYSGNSIKRVLKRIKKYVPMRCKINACLYAVKKSNAKKILNIWLNIIKKINLKCRCQLIDVQCHELSINLVSAILEAGMPYTTFVYPIWGETVQDIGKDYQLLKIRNKDQRFNLHKWETQYLNIEKNINKHWVSDISKYSCVRIYRTLGDKNLECFLPFLFLKEIKDCNLDVWFTNMADSFRILGENEIAEEIEEALKAKTKWKKDAVEYLACMFSCFCSKASAEILNLKKYLNSSNVQIENSFRGSFSPNVINLLKKCDSDFADRFFDVFSPRVSRLDIFSSNKLEKINKPFQGLKKYVLQNYKNMDVFEMTRSIFKWLKSHDSDFAFNRHERKALRLDDIVYILKEVADYDIESIYLAQIECWDVGIATYRFSYERGNGLVVKCIAGEISSVLTILKYKHLVRCFFDKVYENQLNSNAKTQNDILADVYQTAIDEKQYTEQEIEEFKSILKDRNGSIYSLLI